MNNEITAVNPSQLLTVAVEKGVDVDQLGKLMDLEQRHNDRLAREAFQGALGGFQSECPIIKKTKSGHNIKYAPLEDIIAQIKPALAKYGLTYRWEQSQTEQGITVKTIVTHTLGHSESLELTAGADTSGSKNSVQAIGSTITYLRRYGLTGALGVVVADEDSDARVSAVKQVSSDYAQQLCERANQAGMDVPKMLEFYGVTSFGEMTDANARHASAMISKRLEQSNV